MSAGRSSKRRATLLLILLVGILAAAGVAGWWWWPRTPASPPGAGPRAAVEDPRLTYPTHYRNVRPDVPYVGDDQCATCHAEVAASYRRHPMGRSLFPVADAPPLERYDAAANNPFQAHGMFFTVERRGRQVFHRQAHRDAQGKVLTETVAEVHYAIGSGQQGRSYLVSRDGFLFQSPVSWYSHKGGWDLSPGYAIRYQEFERPILPECLFCHANAAAHVPHTVNRYREPAFRGHTIGCERCHGPGALHVELRLSGDEVTGPDPTIVNPRHLEPALRDAVCHQCHLQGETRVARCGRSLTDFRPGLPLHLVLSVFTRPPENTDAHKAVSHAEQVPLSRCYQASAGKLGCISCHDPHQLPAAGQRVAYYRDRCLGCHKEADCDETPAARAQEADSCIACHMAAGKTGNVPHTAITDHRILRRPDARPQVPPAPRLGDVPLVHFHRDLVAPDFPGLRRDLGLAMIEKAHPVENATVKAHIGRTALPLLEQAVRDDPQDVAAWEALGQARFFTSQLAEALAAAEAALRLAPQREVALNNAGHYATRLDRQEAAIGYWQRLLAVNPWHATAHYDIGRVLGGRGDWTGALAQARAALQHHPTSTDARTLEILCHLRLGRRARAEELFAELIRLKPAEADALRRWFAGQARGGP